MEGDAGGSDHETAEEGKGDQENEDNRLQRRKKADFNMLRAVRHGLLGRYSKVKRNARDLVVLKGTVSKAQQQSVPVQRKDSEHSLKPVWLH